MVCIHTEGRGGAQSYTQEAPVENVRGNDLRYQQESPVFYYYVVLRYQEEWRMRA